MTRSVPAFLVIAALLLGAPNRAYCGGSPSSGGGDIEDIVVQLAVEYGPDLALFVGKAIMKAAMDDLHKGKFTTKVQSVTNLPDNIGLVVGLPKTYEVVLEATSDKKTVSKESTSSLYDPNAKTYLTHIAKVEVVAFYPFKEIRYANGKLVLPKEFKLHVGYLGGEGEHGTWTYYGGAGWDKEECQKVAKQLAYDSLEAARKTFMKSLPNFENEVAQAFEKEIDRLIVKAKNSERRKREPSKP
jgi:hypothetical protein